MEKLRALFRGSFSALTSELVAFAAAVQDCERDISGGSQAQKEEVREALMSQRLFRAAALFFAFETRARPRFRF